MTQTLRATVSVLALCVALGVSASWFENSQQAAYRTFQDGDYAQAAAEFVRMVRARDLRWVFFAVVIVAELIVTQVRRRVI